MTPCIFFPDIKSFTRYKRNYFALIRLFTVCYNIYIVSNVAANVGCKKGERYPLNAKCCDEKEGIYLFSVFSDI